MLPIYLYVYQYLVPLFFVNIFVFYITDNSIIVNVLEDGSITIPTLENKKVDESKFTARNSAEVQTVSQPIQIISHETASAILDDSTIDINQIDTNNEQTGALSTLNDNSSTSSIKLAQFQIPWEKIPSDIVQILENKRDIGTYINKLANVLVDEMRIISNKVPMTVIKSIARNISSQFPESFVEKDDSNNLINSEPVALINTMKNRVNFLNRAPKRPLSLHNPVVPIKERRKTDTLTASCSNWQPGVSLNQMESHKIKQQQLMHWHKTNQNSSEILETITDFMKNTYAAQRVYLNNRKEIPQIVDVKQNWPYLFVKPHMFNHLDLLLNMNTQCFVNNFNTSKQKVSSVLQSKKIITNTTNNDNDIINGIVNFFHEDINFLYKKIEVYIF